MPSREWTGSAHVLPEAIRALAVEIANDVASIKEANASATNGHLSLAAAHEAAKFAEKMGDHAYSLSEWADAVEQLYAKRSEGAPYTNAQGVALANRITDSTRRVVVYPSPFDLPAGWLLVRYEDVRTNPVTGANETLPAFECGIAPNGSVSS